MSAHLGLVTLLVRDMPRAKDPAGNYIQVYHLHPQVQEMQKQEGLG